MKQVRLDAHSLSRVSIAMLRRPAFWLAVQSLVLVVFFVSTGRLGPRREADTRTYISASKSTSIEVALSRIRTMGYPLVLRALEQRDRGAPGGPYARVPTVQLMLFVGSVWLFWFGLSRFMGAPWLALAAASPLLWGESMSLMKSLLPDFLALAFIIASIGLLFLLVVRASWWLWIALMLTLFVSYQLRPAGVFLIALVPALAFVLLRLRDRATWAEAFRLAAVAALVAAAPYLGFAALRWATVGHFGLVSFGGYNAAGMAIVFLDDEVGRELPRSQRGLVKGLLRAKVRRGWEVPGLEEDWNAVVREQYSDNIFKIATPHAKYQVRKELETGKEGLNPRGLDRPDYLVVEANRRLTEISRSILSLRPRLYSRWVRNSLGHGLESLAGVALIRWPLVLLAISLPVAFVRRRGKAASSDSGTSQRGRALAGLALLATGYFAAYLVLVALVSYPFPRYFVSMVLFLPSLLTALLFESWRLILTPRSGSSASP